MIKLTHRYWFVCILIILTSCTNSYQFEDQSILLKNDRIKIKLTPYGDQMVRVQYAALNQDFFPDDHYEMIEHHNFDGELKITEQESTYEVSVSGESLLKMVVNKKTLQLHYLDGNESILREKAPFSIQNDSMKVSFVNDTTEHFTGLGHSYFGRSESIDLKGKIHKRNYGSRQIEQAPLIVPFYISSKGYGIFLNSTFENYFNFGENQTYEFGIHTDGFEGRMDYFFLLGSSIKDVLKEYVSLTGKPRLPQKSMFGLQLSDKAHDHNSKTPSDQKWWQKKIKAHKEAGFPIDHVVNDNRWRAGGGKRCESYIEWDRTRYPNPEDYHKWLQEQGLTLTLDFNRCIGQFSEGWKPEFNIPVTDSIDFKESAPDLTNAEFRAWFWDIFYRKSLNPTLDYPGDGLWIDEFDEMGKAPKDMILSNGRSSAEMRNYWFFLIAKALVKDGWDQQIGESKRPYVWVRGMTAGAQRYATLWSGDIKPNYKDMKSQIRGMQLAGLSGFPFWGHDAGGFFDWEKSLGPDEQLYQQWSMAMGAFSPIWKPHGMGQSRWPLDRSKTSQQVAKTFADLRYALMPYTYSIAYEAHNTGLPMARAMILNYGDKEKAWKYDLQYLWGDDILVAASTSKDDLVSLWLPEGGWYNFWDETFHSDELEMLYEVSNHEYPIYIKAGAILPMVKPTSSTAFSNNKELTLHIYTGADGQFTLYEDDGKTEAFRSKQQYRQTTFVYNDQQKRLTIEKAVGDYQGSPTLHNYRLVFHGVSNIGKVTMNSAKDIKIRSNSDRNTTTMELGVFSIDEKLIIEFSE